MNGSCNAVLDKEEHVLKLGESFEKRAKSSFHTIRCESSARALFPVCFCSCVKAASRSVLCTLAIFHMESAVSVSLHSLTLLSVYVIMHTLIDKWLHSPADLHHYDRESVRPVS